jgi:Phosphotransferase enzyme family
VTYPLLAELLAVHGLAGASEEPLPNDGWSGARLTRLQGSGGARFVLKRDSLDLDWIARETSDVPELREAVLAHAGPRLPVPVQLPHLGVGRDGDLVALLMPDLSETLLHWEAPVSLTEMDRVLGALASLHREPWQDQVPGAFPWTDLRRRLLLLTRRSAARYHAEGNPVGARFLEGWDAFDRHAPAAARALIDGLTEDAEPLFAALARVPSAGLHGDLKLGNVGLAGDGSVWLIDWQMTLVAPIAVELGWFLVCNVAGLPLQPHEVLDRYRRAAGLPADALWAAQRDLALVVGLLLRGWRKGLDADAGLSTACGWTADEDLAWWGREAVAAARRRL